jgi:hypothetical protein
MKTVNERMQDGLRDTIGNLTLQVLTLQAQNADLIERLASVPPPAPEGTT